MNLKLSLLGLLIPFIASAQVDYDSTLQNIRCIELKAIDLGAYDPSLVYEWDFGDGTVDQGLIVNHCYEEDGAYIATLSIEDPQSETRFEDDYSLEVWINCEVALKIDATKRPNGNYDFKGILTGQDSIKDVKFYWDLGGDYKITDEVEDYSVIDEMEVRLLAKFKMNEEAKALSKTIKLK